MIRRAGYALTAIGLLVVVWVGITLVWGDPVTSLYTRYEQHRLAARLGELDTRWQTALPDAALQVPHLDRQAARFARTLHDGEAIGRIVVPRLGLRMVVVQGTTEGDLEKAPGHYDAGSGRNTDLPGMGGVIGIAGHRTTYLHPFRHIDDLRAGDRIYLQMPYGTFRYVVYAHRIVTSTDWSILEKTGFEKLVLSACHPLYSATHRWVVFARLQAASA